MGNPGKAGPSLAWFIVPCILMIAALTLVGFGLSSFLHFARSDIRAYQPDSSISVSRDGFTLYTLDSAATGSADLQCTAGQPAGPGIRLRLQPISGRVTWSNGQGSFVAIASTPREVPPGRYVISCINTLGDTAVPLYLGPRVDLGAVARLVVFTVITPLFLGACSIVLFAILVILRYRSHRKPSPAGRPATPA
jgi:hypothetical protein